MAAPSLTDLLAGLGGFAQNQEQVTRPALTSAFDEAGAAIQAQTELAQQRGVLASEIEAQAGKGRLQAQEGARKFAQAAGTDVNAVGEIQTGLADMIRSTSSQLIAQQQKNVQIAQGSSLSNPMGFMYDLLYGDEERNKEAALASQVDTSFKLLQGINQATQTVAVTQKQIAQVESEASVAAQADLKRNLAIDDAYARQRELATVKTNYIQTMAQMDSQQLDVATKQYTLVAQEQERQAQAAARTFSQQMQLAQFDAMQEQRGWMREQRNLDRNERAAKQKGDDLLLSTYNTGAAALGRPTVNWDGLGLAMKLDKDATGYVLQRGQELSMSGGTSMRYTDGGPVEALAARQQFGFKVPATQEPLFTAVEGIVNGMSPDMLVTAGLAKSSLEARAMIDGAKKPADKQKLMNTVVDAVVRTEAQNLRFGETEGLYALPPVDSMKADAKILQNNKFLAKYVLPDVMAGGAIPWNPGSYIERSAEDVRSGAITSAERAQGLADVTKYLFNTMRATRNYSAVGLPELDKYTAQVQTKGVPMRKVVNGLDPAAWNQFAAEYEAKARAKQFTFGAGMIAPPALRN